VFALVDQLGVLVVRMEKPKRTEEQPSCRKEAAMHQLVVVQLEQLQLGDEWPEL
jgi:hypothetical protein